MADYLGLGLPLWAPPAADPTKKRDQWTTVADLRSPGAAADRYITHISPRSTADHLHDDESNRV